MKYYQLEDELKSITEYGYSVETMADALSLGFSRVILDGVGYWLDKDGNITGDNGATIDGATPIEWEEYGEDADGYTAMYVIEQAKNKEN